MRQDTLDDMLYTLRYIARQHGYALLVHGTLRRDIDLVAVPWVEHPEVSSPTRLAHAIRDALAGRIMRASKRRPNDRKPHGRQAWTIVTPHLHKLGPDWIDLSVMPPMQKGG